MNELFEITMLFMIHDAYQKAIKKIISFSNWENQLKKSIYINLAQFFLQDIYSFSSVSFNTLSSY